MLPRKKELLKNLFKGKKPSGSSSDPSNTCSDSPSPKAASALEQDPYAPAATSSEYSPTPDQQPVLPLRDSTAPPGGARAAETYDPDTSGPQDFLRPLPPSEIRKRTYDALTRRLTPEELRRVGWEEYEGTTADKAAENIEDLKETLSDKKQHSKTMSNILQYINKYSAIVDVAIQHNPDITALVWAVARTLIQVSRTLKVSSQKEISFSPQLATNHYETLVSLEQATEAITTSLVKCEFYHKLYVSFAEANTQTSDSGRIFTTLESRLPELYATVIELSVKSAEYMASSSERSH